MTDFEHIRQNRKDITVRMNDALVTSGSIQEALHLLQERLSAYAYGNDYISFRMDGVGYHIYMNKIENKLYLATAMDIPKETA